jgi:hypothetical protein
MVISIARLVATVGLLFMPIFVSAAPVVPPSGGAAIFLKEPIYLTGISANPRDANLAPYSIEFPDAARTEHLRVVNAGYWLVNQVKPTQIFYEFTLSISKPFDKRVFTRVRLDNPAEPTKPIQYEHYIDPTEKSTKATHGPLRMVKRGEKYTLRFELFADEARAVLLEELQQEIVAPLDNTSGCTELQQSVMLAAFPALTSSKVKVPFDKVILACDK